MDKFAGLGLKNLVLVSIFVCFFIIVAKTISIKHPIPGVTEAINAI